MLDETWGGFQEQTHCTSFVHLDIGLERILLFVVRIYPQDLDPLPIVEVALPIGERPFEEFVDLRATPRSREKAELDLHAHL